MIEAKVDITSQKKEVYISQLNGGFEEIARDIATIIDRILADELIKISPKMMKLSIDEKEKLILAERRNLLEEISKLSFDEHAYIESDETSLYLTQRYGI